MPKLADFLIDVAGDPDALASYRKNPKTFLRKADLTDEQRAVLLSGDAVRIQYALEYEAGGKLPADVMMGVVLCPPLPRPAPRPSKRPGRKRTTK